MATVRDLKIDATTGDLVVDGADLALVSDLDAIGQSVRTRLRFFLGEWFADLDVGVPWWQSILVRNPNLGVVREALRSTVANTPGISRVESFDFAFTAATRDLTVSFRARADTGELIVFDESVAPTPQVT